MASARLGACALAVLCCALWAAPARAYSPHATHPWIARQAVQYLVHLYPGDYDELLEYVDRIAAGSRHEDDYFLDGDQDPLTLRVMRHFYRPTDGKGFDSDSWGQFPNSYEWGIVGSDQNEWDYQDALEHYQRGNLEEAYFTIGHAVHLISDLTVPAHTHLDDHGPPNGDDFEVYCRELTISEYEARLPLPAPGTALPDVSSVQELWEITANASYWRNMYDGSLEGETASGVIAQMFPSIELDWLSMQWKIPGVGTLGSGFVEEIPNYFYFAKLGATPAYDKDFSPLNPGGQTLVPADGKSMAERIADDMVPLAVLHSAAVLKLYVDEARSLPDLPPEGDAGDKEPEPDREDVPDTASCSAGGGTGSLTVLWALALFPLIARRRRSCS